MSLKCHQTVTTIASDLGLTSASVCGDEVRLTGQLGSDGLEGKLLELFDQRSEVAAADQLMLAVVQFIHGHHAVGENSFHQNTIPTEKQKQT